MPQWLLLVTSLLAFAAGAFALLRANRLDAAVRRALAALPRDGAPAPQGGSEAPAAAERTVVLPDAQGPLTRVAMVRFDAFADIGGKLSSSAAVLDDQGTGLVITTMNGRESTRTYIKQVRRGIGVSALSPEESDAVARAMAPAKRVP
jgi:hypothetical protein